MQHECPVMSDTQFHTAQRQSVTGVLLIFATALYHMIRNFWAVGVYLLIMDPDPRLLLFSGIGLAVLLIGTLGYSILYYLKFIFYIDEGRNSFILEKGVFNTDVVNIPFSKIQQVNFRRNILQRAIGVYSVVIDTAGSNDKEVEIKALSKEKADLLAELLMDLSTQEKGEAANSFTEDQIESSHTPATEWEYKLDFLTLLKLGLTSNYLRGLSILLAFYFTVRSQFSYSEEFPVELPYAVITEIFSTVVLILILLLVGMLITVAETFIKYYGLHLLKNKSGLQVEMGLRNNTKVNLKSRRVQLLQEETNPIHQRLNLYKIKISLASSRDDLNKDQIKVPGLSSEVVSKVKEYFYESEFIEESSRILPHRILLLRMIFRSVIPLIAGVLLLFLFMPDVPEIPLGIGAGLLIVGIVLYQYFYFKAICLSISKDFLMKHSGVWNRRKHFLEMYKLQSVSLSQPVWYKKRGLVNITFHSAGGDISYPLVSKEEILPLMNYILFRIESTSKPWM